MSDNDVCGKRTGVASNRCLLPQGHEGECDCQVIPATDEPVTIQNSSLILALMEQSSRDRTYTTNALLDGYRSEAATQAATVGAIRFAILGLLNGPYAPSASAIERALYPSAGTIAAFRPQDE